MYITSALSALESLSSSTSTSSSGPLNALIDDQFTLAKSRILSGEDPKTVITELQKNVKNCKKDVEKGLKSWYGALGNLGKEVDKAFPPNLADISEAYSDPPLFADPEAAQALDRAILESLGRRGLWDAVEAIEKETSLRYPKTKRDLSTELQHILLSIDQLNLQPALEWCSETKNTIFLNSPPHPSSLPYHLHKLIFKLISLKDKQKAIKYANENLIKYVPTQPVLKLITACLYDKSDDSTQDRDGDSPMNYNDNLDRDGNEDDNGEEGMIENDESKSMTMHKSRRRLSNGNSIETISKAKEKEFEKDKSELVEMFKNEFCRRYQWSKEDSLKISIELGSKFGSLDKIEKARKVMGEHLGNIRKWDELPMEVPLPPERRYHSVFVCPVSKEQATESNPPKMLTCGHVIAEESFNRLLKGGRRSVKCPYCPMETSQSVAQRLYF
ncbi:uncharacterized protein L201_002200 [Kwoniella dendrophila CBS 6074]|uniref:GID complex catalytic subunit 2 n=1 Tax=Kwoniella dendrophila CBS 6074 TaxID=1295534 RepID=A0AAX4JPI9_9TREE